MDHVFMADRNIVHRREKLLPALYDVVFKTELYNTCLARRNEFSIRLAEIIEKSGEVLQVILASHNSVHNRD